MISDESFITLQEELEDLLDARAALEKWKRDPSTARRWEEIEAELIAEGRLEANNEEASLAAKSQ